VAIENPHLQSIVDQDGAVILDIEQWLISTLNPTGAYVWRGLQRGESLETIIANLARETGQEPLTVERDVREFVEDLKQKRLLPH
jgi:Coenzyme PQQ synthesis protein D (PqqD)